MRFTQKHEIESVKSIPFLVVAAQCVKIGHTSIFTLGVATLLKISRNKPVLFYFWKYRLVSSIFLIKKIS